MNKAVVVLGAGASQPFGVPTLVQIFKEGFARRHLRHDVWMHEQLQQLFWSPRGHDLETSHIGLSVEEILTIVRDYEEQAYGVPMIFEDEEKSKRFKKSLYVLIKKATYDGKSTQGRYLNPLIDFMRKEYRRVTWASFNWDCIFESSYYYSSAENPSNRSNPRVVVELNNWYNSSGSHFFLKLHGGVNWWYENESLLYLPFGSQTNLNDRWNQYEQREIEGYPVILEPSYYKYNDPIYEHLKCQWDTFVEHLLDADLVLVVGYSLPEADLEARRALTIGFQSNAQAKFILVDRAKWVCDRYERLFGKIRLLTINKGLEDIYQELPQMIIEHMNT